MLKSLQELYAPKGICFGCGCANDHGLKVQSFVEGNAVVSTWTPKNYHEAFPGVLNGGIIGTLLDCHSNWAAAYRMMIKRNEKKTPCTVTADYSIKLLRPTPSNRKIKLSATMVGCKKKRATVCAELIVDSRVCATCLGTFVAVGPGHPAYHRW